jgi:hypothetical protein
VICEFCKLCLLQPHPHQGMWVGCIMSHKKLCYFANVTKLHSSKHHGKMLVLAEDFGIVPIMRYEFVLIMAIHFVFIKF